MASARAQSRGDPAEHHPRRSSHAEESSGCSDRIFKEGMLVFWEPVEEIFEGPEL